MIRYLIFAFLLPSLTFTTEITLLPERCLNQAQYLGGVNKINEGCYDILKPLTDDSLIRTAIKEKFEVFAYQNILAFKDDDNGVRFISGASSKLVNARRIELSADEKEVTILNQNSHDTQILSFKSDRDGNVKPRLLTHKNFKAVTSLARTTDNHIVLGSSIAVNEITLYHFPAILNDALDLKKGYLKRYRIKHSLTDIGEFIVHKDFLIIHQKTAQKIIKLRLVDGTFKLDNEFPFPSNQYGMVEKMWFDQAGILIIENDLGEKFKLHRQNF